MAIDGAGERGRDIESSRSLNKKKRTNPSNRNGSYTARAGKRGAAGLLSENRTGGNSGENGPAGAGGVVIRNSTPPGPLVAVRRTSS